MLGEVVGDGIADVFAYLLGDVQDPVVLVQDAADFYVPAIFGGVLDPDARVGREGAAPLPDRRAKRPATAHVRSDSEII